MTERRKVTLIEGAEYKFLSDVESAGWSFPAGTVVTLVDTFVPHFDWFQMMVAMPDGEKRRIGAGVLDLYTEKVTECSAARTGDGYWTCDVPGGCPDCRTLALELNDRETFAPTERT